MHRRTYTEGVVAAGSLKDYGVHTFVYSSDEFPYYARVSQPCWGPLGGLKPGQQNLHIWIPTISAIQQVMGKDNPYFKYVNDVLDGMFTADATVEQRLDFVKTYGLLLTPSVLEKYPAPVVVGFLMTARYGDGSLINNNAFDTIVGSLVNKNYEGGASLMQAAWGPSDIIATWDSVENFLTGRFNTHHSKLVPYAQDPDYSCWDSPIKNLFTNHDIIQTGKYITARATDITWDDWVVRNPDNGDDWYGRNNGYSNDPKSGEVAKAIKEMLGPKFKAMPFKQVQDAVSAFILEKVKVYEKAA